MTEYRRLAGKYGFNETEREKEYVKMKRCPRNESFADGSVGARVSLMMRGGCLPVRGSERMAWKMMMIGVGVGKSKQKYMCCFNATDMEKSEENGEG